MFIERVCVEKKAQVCKQDFAVVMSMYNTDGYIVRALESILHQSVIPNEIHIIDDASTDSSVATVREKFKDRHDIKVFVNKINVGPFLNKNRLLRKLKDRYLYFAFLDSDDFILHETFCEMFKVIDSDTTVDVVLPHMYRVEKYSVYKFKLESTRCCFAGSMLKAHVLDKIGYFEPLRYAADGGFFYRCRQNLKQTSFVEIKKPLYRAEIRKESLTNKVSYTDVDDTADNYLSAERQMYCELFLTNIEQRVTYLKTFGLSKTMLAAPIHYCEHPEDTFIEKGLFLNTKSFNRCVLSLDSIIDCLLEIGPDTPIDCSFQKTTFCEDSWLAVWKN